MTAFAVLAKLKARNATIRAAQGAPPGKGRPLAIGFGREVPVALRNVDLGSLHWTVTDDGGKAARIDVQSPGAAALRLALKFTSAASNITLRFAGSAAPATVFGPTPARTLVEDTTG